MRKLLIVLMAVAMVTFLFAGCFPVKNQVPIITSDPVKTATVGVEYNYDVEATDPDAEDVLTYSLTTKPSGMIINSATGLIKWTPTIEGDYAVIVKVSDGDLDIIQSFTIVVGEPEPIENNPPEIISSAITSGKVGVAYTYDVNATDPEGDVLTYCLTEKPLGMSIVATTGIISWTPTDAGLFGVGVKVSDPDGLSDVQSFNITVAKADEEEPEPEPELVLVGITVDPKTMDLIVGETEFIESVTACYEVRGYEVDILGDCLFLSSDTDVATISDGEVTAVGEGTADILVSYGGKFDTLKVTVAYLPMEIKIVDMPVFEVGIPGGVIIEIVANSDAGKKVQPYLILPDEVVVLIEFWLIEDGVWLSLNIQDDGTIDEFPPYLLGDVVDVYSAEFSKAGIYSAKLEFRTYPGDVLLGSKVIEAVVLPIIPPVT